jgi:hypothetical protein
LRPGEAEPSSKMRENLITRSVSHFARFSGRLRVRAPFPAFPRPKSVEHCSQAEASLHRVGGSRPHRSGRLHAELLQDLRVNDREVRPGSDQDPDCGWRRCGSPQSRIGGHGHGRRGPCHDGASRANRTAGADRLRLKWRGKTGIEGKTVGNGSKVKMAECFAIEPGPTP